MKTLVILIGPPGSGKTTYSKELEAIGYVRVSQDANNGDRGKTTEHFIKALEAGKNVVLDRCNINKDQRRVWINKALSAGYQDITGVKFVVDRDVCIERVLARKEHETIKETFSREKVESIVDGFRASFEEPKFEEGFTALIVK